MIRRVPCCTLFPYTTLFRSGQISGFVRDQSSAIVPGATVIVTNEGTKELHRTVSNSDGYRSEEHTSELQSRQYLVCRLLLEKKKFRKAVRSTASAVVTKKI